MQTVNESIERPFVTTGDIVRIASVHPNTVAMWRSTGRIKPKDKIGSSFLYDRKEVLSFLSHRKNRGDGRTKEREKTDNGPQHLRDTGAEGSSA